MTNYLVSCFVLSFVSLSLHDELLSKAFSGRQGRGMLFDRVINVTKAPAEERLFTTGLHRVSDISCVKCFSPLGWFYWKAREQNQKYKEGKYLLEKSMIIEVQQ